MFWPHRAAPWGPFSSRLAPKAGRKPLRGGFGKRPATQHGKNTKKCPKWRPNCRPNGAQNRLKIHLGTACAPPALVWPSQGVQEGGPPPNRPPNGRKTDTLLMVRPLSPTTQLRGPTKKIVRVPSCFSILLEPNPQAEYKKNGTHAPACRGGMSAANRIGNI